MDAGACNPGSDPTNPATINPSQATGTSSSYLQLLVIRPDGSSSIQQVDGASTSFINWYQPQITSGSPRFWAPERAVPDGNGGVFLPAGQTLYHGNGSGFSYATLPIIAPHCYAYEFYDCDPLLLGEDGTAYLAGYSSPTGQIDTATAIDPNSGSPKWTWQSPGVSLNTVTADGTVAVQVGNALQLIDRTGQTAPALSTTPVGSDSNYYTNGNWSTELADGSFGLVSGDTLYIASTERPQKKGSGQKKNAPRPPEILEYLPSFIETSSTDPLTTKTFPSKMDATVTNQSNPNPSAKGIPVNQHYNVRSGATVQQFSGDISKPHDAVAYLGHAVDAAFDNGNGAQLFSIGLNFYYPVSPGTNPGDASTWDITNSGNPPGTQAPYVLPGECAPPTLPDNCDGSLGHVPVNKLLPLEKDVATVTGFTESQYGNDLVTKSDTPAPPHRPILLANKLPINAKVMFAAACYLIPGGQILTQGQVPIFLQMWDIHDAAYDAPETRDRAIILPAAGTESLLEDAAQQWIYILNDMVNNKKTVQQAVDDVNKNDKLQQFVVYGNHAVNITTAPVSP